MLSLPSKPTSSTYSIQSKTIGVAAFSGAQMLDITGPLEVFCFANYVLKQENISSSPVYRVKVIAEKRCEVTTMSGLKIVADTSYADLKSGLDTLLIPGGSDVDSFLKDTLLLDWVLDISPKLRRLASICTGAFLLAENGLLNGRRATTHWNYCQRLASDYPLVNVEPDKIFVRDDFISTSGGITSGIDLALAMVEEDWGRELALSVARYLVVFLKRPGGQSQFSSYLTNEATDHHGLRTLQVWIMENPKEDLRVDTLAQRVSMSPRNYRASFSATDKNKITMPDKCPGMTNSVHEGSVSAPHNLCGAQSQERGDERASRSLKIQTEFNMEHESFSQKRVKNEGTMS